MRAIVIAVRRATIATALAATLVTSLGITAANAAAPTITSFTPTSALIVSDVTITGTGFLDSSVVTSVAFNGVAATEFTVSSDTRITAVVPIGASTGPITVTDSEGTAMSETDFFVEPTPEGVARSVSLYLRRHLIARGVINSGGFRECFADFAVELQRLTPSGWRTVAVAQTEAGALFGHYRTRIPGSARRLPRSHPQRKS